MTREPGGAGDSRSWSSTTVASSKRVPDDPATSRRTTSSWASSGGGHHLNSNLIRPHDIDIATAPLLAGEIRGCSDGFEVRTTVLTDDGRCVARTTPWAPPILADPRSTARTVRYAACLRWAEPCLRPRPPGWEHASGGRMPLGPRRRCCDWSQTARLCPDLLYGAGPNRNETTCKIHGTQRPCRWPAYALVRPFGLCWSAGGHMPSPKLRAGLEDLVVLGRRCLPVRWEGRAVDLTDPFPVLDRRW